MGSWLSSAWHAAGGPIAAAAAIASGNPELAQVAYAAGSAASAKKPSQPQQPTAAQVAAAQPAQGGFMQAYHTLTPADQEIILAGGVLLGSFVLYRALFGRGSR
jgi:hypothetical protein